MTFPSFDLKNFDVKRVVEIIMQIEHDASILFFPITQIKMKFKYKFHPIETYHMRVFVQENNDKEFLQAKTAIELSDDDEEYMNLMLATRNEFMHRYYDTNLVQSCIKTNESITQEKGVMSSNGQNLSPYSNKINNQSRQQTSQPQYGQQPQLQRSRPQQLQSAQLKPSLQDLFQQCGLEQEHIQKLQELKINKSNIEFLTYEDFKNLGLPIGPSRQLDAMLKKQKQQQNQYPNKNQNYNNSSKFNNNNQYQNNQQNNGAGFNNYQNNQNGSYPKNNNINKRRNQQNNQGAQVCGNNFNQNRRPGSPDFKVQHNW